MRKAMLFVLLISVVTGRSAIAQRATESPSFEEVKQWVESYKASHGGNRGRDWDINAKTPAQIAADPAAQQLLSVCGQDQRPVIPVMAWEYGGSDHQWINPQEAALVYCVYTPVRNGSAHWRYDRAKDEVTADVYVKFPEENPCRNESGASRIVRCIGDPSNFEILVDTASINDGRDAGLSLSNAATTLNLLLPDQTRVFVWRDE